MGKGIVDLTGKRYGMLYVLGMIEERRNGSIQYKCLCDCGNIVYRIRSELNKKLQASCGCGRRTKDVFVGARFGKLVVIEDLRETKCKRPIVCKCDCGNIVNVSTGNLTSNGTKSCGCAKSIKGDQHFNALPRGIAAFNNLYKNYRDRALKRQYSFELTKDEFRDLTSSKCFYCGSEPFLSFLGCSTRNGDYIYNGIDRVDNSKGYISGNCVTCCKWCNQAKSSMSLEDFIVWVSKVYKKFESEGFTRE